jgi:2-hydroxy-3-oxopropionate reductase
MTSPMAAPSVCVVGLGLMGRPIAGVLSGAGVEVRGWNRSGLAPETIGSIELVSRLDEAAQAEVILIIVSDSAATGAVLGELMPHLRAGSIVLDMGSSDPADSLERAAALRRIGVGWVDAPVSGGPPAAQTGSLAIMAGGSDSDFVRVQPLLEILGANVGHVGAAGAGHAMKAVNQLIVGLSIETVAEALALADSLGFGADLVQRTLRGGSADNPQLNVQGSRMGERLYEPGGRIRTVLKDLRLAAKLADSHSLSLPVLRTTLELYASADRAGAGDEDCAVLYEQQVRDGRLRSADTGRTNAGSA